MSVRKRLKQIERAMGSVDSEFAEETRSLLLAWLACKAERFESLRRDDYVPPTDEQRALVAQAPYDLVQRAFAMALSAQQLSRRFARKRTVNDAQISVPDDPTRA